MRLHQVAPGDTLFSIAASYHLPLDALLAVNDKPSPAVRVGEVIFLPTAAKVDDVTSFATRPVATTKGGDLAGWNGAEGGGSNAAGAAVERGDVDNGSQQQQRGSQTSQLGSQRLSQPSQPSNKHLNQEDAEIKVSQDFALKFREKPGGNYPGKYVAGPNVGQQRNNSGAREGGKARGGGGREGGLLGGRKESRESGGGGSRGSLRSNSSGKGEEARKGRAVAGAGLQRIEVCEEREVASAFASVGAPKIPYLDCTPVAAAPSRLAATAFRQQPQQLQLRRLQPQQPLQQPQQLKLQQLGRTDGGQQRIAGGQVGGGSVDKQHRSTFLGGSAQQFTATVGQQQFLLPEGKLLAGSQHGGRWAVALGVAVAVAAGGAALGGRVGASGGAAGATTSVHEGMRGLFGGGGHDASKGRQQEVGSAAASDAAAAAADAAEGVGIKFIELKTYENQEIMESQVNMESQEDRCVSGQGNGQLRVGEEAGSSETTWGRKEAWSSEEGRHEVGSWEEGEIQAEWSREEGSRAEGSNEEESSEEGSRVEEMSREGGGREEGMREDEGIREEEGLSEGEENLEEGNTREKGSIKVVCAEGLPLEEVQNWSVEEAIAANAQVARKMGLQQG
ncbi:unnamed protein product [Closterium sp. Naga37s-1]|nr:unnamed protein product [Closterium sp. Naga37s-1]